MDPMSSYKLVTFASADGPRAGMVVDDRVSDIAALTGKPAYATMLGVLADWPAADAMLRKAAASSAAAGGMPLAQVQLLAPIPHPGLIEGWGVAGLVGLGIGAVGLSLRRTRTTNRWVVPALLLVIVIYI